jgi:hypothetical protein
MAIIYKIKTDRWSIREDRFVRNATRQAKTDLAAHPRQHPVVSGKPLTHVHRSHQVPGAERSALAPSRELADANQA